MNSATNNAFKRLIFTLERLSDAASHTVYRVHKVFPNADDMFDAQLAIPELNTAVEHAEEILEEVIETWLSKKGLNQ